MDSLLKSICDLFLENKNNCRGVYTTHIGGTGLENLFSYIFTFHDQKIEHERMLEQYHYLYRNEISGIYRNATSIALMCYMDMSKDSDAFFKQVESIFDMFPQNEFYDYPVSVGTMIQDCKPDDFKTVVDRTFEIYNRLKKAHKFKISVYHLPWICCVALTDRLVDDLIEDFECIYKLKGSYVGKALRVLGESYDEEQVLEMFAKKETILKMLNKKKHPLTYYAFSELFMSRPESAETIVNLIIEVDDYLKPHKDFHGFLSLKRYRSIIAAILVQKYLIDKDRGNREFTIREFTIEEKIAHYHAMLLFQDAVFDDSTPNTP